MIKNRSFRRFVIAATLFVGLFAQFQTVFACEFKDGKLQFVCCCDKSGDMSKDCNENDRCDDQQVIPKSDDSNGAVCCEVSYQSVPGATAISSTQYGQQVLLLDAPQPPPILSSFNLQVISSSSQIISFPTDVSLRVTSAHTYLLTQRFRI